MYGNELKKKRMKNIVLVLLIALFLFSCKSSTPSLSAEASKELQGWIENRSFEIKSDRANPKVSNGLNPLNSEVYGAGSNASSINLVGNPNYLRVHQDSVFAHLPFYGTRQRLQLGKNTGAIQLATIVQNYSSLYKEAKNRTAIHFEAKEGSEIYDVNITVFGNGRTTIHVNSSQRSSISYEGNIAAYPKH